MIQLKKRNLRVHFFYQTGFLASLSFCLHIIVLHAIFREVKKAYTEVAIKRSLKSEKNFEEAYF